MSFVKQYPGYRIQRGAVDHVPDRSFSEEIRWPIDYESVEIITVSSDAATILIASILASAVYHFHSHGTFGDLSQCAGAAVIVAAFFILWMKSGDMYNPAGLLALRHQIAGVFLAWASVFILLAGVVFALKINKDISRGANVLFALFGFVFLIANRVLWKLFLTRGISHRRYSGRKVILITDRSQLGGPGLPIALTKLGFRLEHHFTVPLTNQTTRKREEIVSQVISCVRGSDVEEIMVGSDPSLWPDMRNLIASLRVLPLPVSLIPIGSTADIFKRRFRALGNNVCIELQRGPLSPLECLAKRSLDIVAAGTALFLLLPVLILVGLAIKLESAGPVLFRQQRCGFNGRRFRILKFRTMSVLEDGKSVVQAQRADARVTHLGKWLRRSSIDELPQLLNVLEGSMSLVGPRPHAVAHDIEFDKLVRNYALRQRVKPGLTGWAQVNGYRGPTPTSESIKQRVKFDLWYIDNWSFKLDFMIMLQTVAEVIRGRNAF